MVVFSEYNVSLSTKMETLSRLDQQSKLFAFNSLLELCSNRSRICGKVCAALPEVRACPILEKPYPDGCGYRTMIMVASNILVEMATVHFAIGDIKSMYRYYSLRGLEFVN